MKANYMATSSDIKKLAKESAKEEYTKLEQQHAKSFSVQFWAVMLYVLVKFRGYTHKNAIKFYKDVGAFFSVMDGGIMGRTFDTENCIAFCKQELKLDLINEIDAETKAK